MKIKHNHEISSYPCGHKTSFETKVGIPFQSSTKNDMVNDES